MCSERARKVGSSFTVTDQAVLSTGNGKMITWAKVDPRSGPRNPHLGEPEEGFSLSGGVSNDLTLG